MGNVGFQPFWPRYLAEAFLASCSLKLFSTLMKDARMSHISALLLSLSLSLIFICNIHTRKEICACYACCMSSKLKSMEYIMKTDATSQRALDARKTKYWRNLSTSTTVPLRTALASLEMTLLLPALVWQVCGKCLVNCLQDPPQNNKLIASADLCAQALPTFLQYKGCGVLVVLAFS